MIKIAIGKWNYLNCLTAYTMFWLFQIEDDKALVAWLQTVKDDLTFCEQVW